LIGVGRYQGSFPLARKRADKFYLFFLRRGEMIASFAQEESESDSILPEKRIDRVLQEGDTKILSLLIYISGLDKEWRFFSGKRSTDFR